MSFGEFLLVGLVGLIIAHVGFAAFCLFGAFLDWLGGNGWNVYKD